ncbi:hypothetical protein QWY90_03965 [Flavobacterium paronense]|uniref:Uncharacterized protein n=1 Tax=Flavobacterium paronense TaxID=1392775 RepID=A0ABV5GHL3_9FLAO|nr:hypothetical protein [Flavobacterium paronense]MDN3676461.1 hypothetical protein [Flavobacterium paronense]
MKSIIKSIFVVIFLISISANAQQKVALHHLGTTTVFSGSNPLIDAYTAAVTNDTIYLPGGTFVSPSNIDKRIAVFGTGHYENATSATGKTFINGNIALKENADNFYMEGVEVNGNFYFSENESVNQVVLKRCKINGTLNFIGNLSIPSTNFGLFGSVIIGNIDLANAQNVLISNSILQGRIFNSIGNVFNNNILLDEYAYYGNEAPINGDNNQVNNNIFTKVNFGNLINGNGNVAKNNLCALPTPSFGTLPTISGNYFGIAQSAIFINRTGSIFTYSEDYHLQNTSSYLGLDGTQVGIYGGVFPYKEEAIPSNPHIESKTIAPQTNTTGELNIQVLVKAQTN